MRDRTVTHDGLTLTIREWAARSKQSAATLRYRLDAGWPVDLALNAPTHSSGRKPSGNTKLAIIERREREFDKKAAHVQNEFAKLVRDIDRSLTAFRNKIDWLLNEDEYRGVDQNFSKTPNDRATRTAQDSV
jgi:hypothetical protein